MLTFACCLIFFQRNLLRGSSLCACCKHSRSLRTRFLAFDIVHAVEFSRIGRSWHATSRRRSQGNFTNLPPGISASFDAPEPEAPGDRTGWVFHPSRGRSFLQEDSRRAIRIRSRLRPVSASALPHLWGDKGLHYADVSGCPNLGASRACRTPGHSTNTPARVFLPRLSTAIRPARTAPSSV